ncbi:uncharacterized protein KQ657_001364 [Scheffersomyces spartinae]|uniref:Uncharacterized protein n=1 Tax=Scheffersomyces spartinae TaxID=45513 RepID=A0A9P7V810_9ASCO|nr:uncharacterized protein KQ657_001364 [Scheffersomyces spartinae]KAG7192907.1 hypothetical protein KQ657_001364 [Scheffersomyces spartinae]
MEGFEAGVTDNLSKSHHHAFDKNAHPFIPHICTIYIYRSQDADKSTETTTETKMATTLSSLIGSSPTGLKEGLLKESEDMSPCVTDIQEAIIREKVGQSLVDPNQAFIPSLYYEFIPGKAEKGSHTNLVDAKLNILNNNINIERLLTLLDELYTTEMTNSIEGGKVYVFSEEDQRYMLVDPLRVFFGNIPYSTTWKKLKKFITSTVKVIDPDFQLNIVKVEIPLIDANTSSFSISKNNFMGQFNAINTPSSSSSSSATTISPTLSPNDTSHLFHPYGQSQQTPHGEHVKSRGFGIVTTTSQKTSKKLVDIFNNMEFEKRVLTVRFDKFPEFSNHHNSTNYKQHHHIYQQNQPHSDHHYHHQQLSGGGHRNSIGSNNKRVYSPNTADYFNLGYERNKYLQFKFYSPSSYMSYMYYPIMGPATAPPPPPPPPPPHLPPILDEIPSGSSSSPSPTNELHASISSLTLTPSESSSYTLISRPEIISNNPSEPELYGTNCFPYIPQQNHPHHHGGPPMFVNQPYAFYYGGIPQPAAPTEEISPMQSKPHQYYSYLGHQGNGMSGRRNSGQPHPLVAAAAIAAQQVHSNQNQAQESSSADNNILAMRSGANSRGGSKKSTGEIVDPGGSRGYLNVHTSEIVHRANSKYLERRKRHQGSVVKINKGTEES